MAANLLSLQMQPFVTPISGALPDDTAIHVGSGGYIDWAGHRLLLTNEHVARETLSHSLARKCFDSDDYLRVTNPFRSIGAPEDLAFSTVQDTWTAVEHSAMAFPDYRFAKAHAPCPAEFLFVMGFTGEKAHYSPMFSTLVTDGTPYLTQEYVEELESDEMRGPVTHGDFDPAIHFAMHWHPEKTTPTDGKSSSVPRDPHGMSGSFVWNTRLVEFAGRGEPWTPGVARLTGIVWGWYTGSRLLFATRIESVRSFLTDQLGAP